MTDVEEQLVRIFGEAPVDDASVARVLAKVSEDIDRQHWRRVARHAIPGVAAAAMLGLAGAVILPNALHHDDPPAQVRAGALPWVPAAPAAQGQPSDGTTVGLDSPACDAADLTGREGNLSLGAGQVNYLFELTNSGDSACTLTGSPSALYGTDVSGASRQIDASTAGDGGSVVLQPGGSVTVAVSLGHCAVPSGDSQTFDGLSIAIPGGGKVSIPKLAKPLSLPCGVGLSSFLSPVDAPHSPLDGLVAALDGVKEVQSGTTATFVVTLQNPTSTDVRLQPCPSYTESIVIPGSPPAVDTESYMLNCEAAGNEIPAGGATSFEMNVHVPGGEGTGKLSWRLQGAGVAAGTTVRVLSSSG